MYIFVLNGVYWILKCLPTQKNKILFLSRQADEPSLDFKMLMEEIQKNDPDCSVVVITKRIQKSFKDVLTKNLPILFRQMVHLATSAVCVTDGYNIPISVLKHKKGLRVIQLWHSLGAVKKFGYQSLTTPKDRLIAKSMCMHKNYTSIISGSEEMIPYFAEAFGYDETVFLPWGLPRVDYLLAQRDANRRKIYDCYPEFQSRKIILYAPTFRNNGDYKISELIRAIDTERYFVVVKLHPNIHSDMDLSRVYPCKEFTTLELLSVAAFVITDYSAVSIEASVLTVPTFLYVYDYEEYCADPGLNIDLYKEFPGCVFRDPDALYRKLDKNDYDLSVVQRYQAKYTSYLDKKVTKRLTDFIVRG